VEKAGDPGNEYPGRPHTLYERNLKLDKKAFYLLIK